MIEFTATIGLEIHAQLKTKHKMFAPECFEFGIMPNSLTSEISLALPGTLPTLNKEAIDLAIKLGLACGGDICQNISFARKNYFYPDLPKGYQITQDKTPICSGGTITFDTEKGEKTISLTRIHLEEDAGKLTHHTQDENIEIDFNRAGVALVEIVTKPDFTSGKEVYDFLHELRRIVRYLGVCNGNMEEGSLRCDANVSIKEKNSNVLGTRIEVKNMNSISNVQKAIEFEIERQKEIVNNGEKIKQETRMYDANKNETFFQREKESFEDYKYFVEPDIKPIFISEEWIKKIKEQLPILPREKKRLLISEKGLTEYQASVLIEEEDLLCLFEEISKRNNNYKTIANWVLGPIKGLLNKMKINAQEIMPLCKEINILIEKVINEEVNYTTATQQVLTSLFLNQDKTIEELIKEKNIVKNNNINEIENIIKEVLTEYSNKVEEYKKGKKGLLGLFVGEVMRKSHGNADPKLINKIILEKIR